MQIISGLLSYSLSHNLALTLNDKKLLYTPKFYDKMFKSGKIDELIPIAI